MLTSWLSCVLLEAYRQRGLMHRAALNSFLAMAEQGYDLTVLRGRHYAKYGYVRAWNYVTVRLKPAEIPQRELQRPYQALGPEHMAQINTIYNRDYQSYTGTAVRPTYGMLHLGDMGAYGWFDDQGTLAGYVRAVPTDDHKTLQCLEATGNPDQGLAVLADLFKQAPYETMTFFTLPHHHPMFRLLRRGACLVENQYFHHTGWQVRRREPGWAAAEDDSPAANPTPELGPGAVGRRAASRRGRADRDPGHRRGTGAGDGAATRRTRGTRWRERGAAVDRLG